MTVETVSVSRTSMLSSPKSCPLFFLFRKMMIATMTAIAAAAATVTPMPIFVPVDSFPSLSSSLISMLTGIFSSNSSVALNSSDFENCCEKVN